MSFNPMSNNKRFLWCNLSLQNLYTEGKLSLTSSYSNSLPKFGLHNRNQLELENADSIHLVSNCIAFCKCLRMKCSKHRFQIQYASAMNENLCKIVEDLSCKLKWIFSHFPCHFPWNSHNLCIRMGTLGSTRRRARLVRIKLSFGSDEDFILLLLLYSQ